MNYKLPRIGDIGELVVEMYQPDSEYKRGVIGLGEPPVIACGAAISNAVANAIGVRVPMIPLTPQASPRCAERKPGMKNIRICVSHDRSRGRRAARTTTAATRPCSPAAPTSSA